jgi:hypothetical protein
MLVLGIVPYTQVPCGISGASLSLSGTRIVDSIAITGVIRKLLSIVAVGQFGVADGVDV